MSDFEGGVGKKPPALYFILILGSWHLCCLTHRSNVVFTKASKDLRADVQGLSL